MTDETNPPRLARYACRDIGYGVEIGAVMLPALDTYDWSGKRPYLTPEGERVYLFDDELLSSSNPEAYRLEELREVLRSESMSYSELAELQDLAAFIEPGDVELLEWAGVPEFETAQELAERIRDEANNHGISSHEVATNRGAFDWAKQLTDEAAAILLTMWNNDNTDAVEEGAP